MESQKHQRQRIYALLNDSECGMTRLQISRILGIERAVVCWRVKELRERDLLWVATVDLDPLTNARAEFLTTRKDVMEKYAKKTDNIFE